MTAEIRFGTQGWNYPDWVGPFYPERTRAADFLATYSRAFDTVEVDSTFYAVPPVKTVRGWAARVPDHFRFALKFPQEITHAKRLRDAGDLTQLFFERARELGPKLGPVLVQFGPDFAPYERPALEEFLPTLPQDVDVAVEFRQRAWISEETLSLLEAHRVALALVDGKWMPRSLVARLAARPTADFGYVRWMGPDRSITQFGRVLVDRTRELDEWTGTLKLLAARVRTISGYVNNHFSGHSPANVRDLQRRLGGTPVDPASLADQLGLF